MLICEKKCVEVYMEQAFRYQRFYPTPEQNTLAGRWAVRGGITAHWQRKNGALL